ncbi:hypothetical protein EJ06DRAFT_531888 [Trichodelitschia bisporula]|uniref:Uncharacterized protein n=1 Tax=Trichodelitschia bisporula TaxID=703511 RepID=A0A6G1HS33_9PEZI|nr:hypothetical protein EJ06DRAFT_531888 [Trichodelitschia bisporula]
MAADDGVAQASSSTTLRYYWALRSRFGPLSFPSTHPPSTSFNPGRLALQSCFALLLTHARLRGKRTYSCLTLLELFSALLFSLPSLPVFALPFPAVQPPPPSPSLAS